jgi:hypothetical protein
MRYRRFASALCVFLVLALAGCTTPIDPAYQVGFRSMAMPVMLNEPARAIQGRTAPIRFDFSNTSSPTYSDAYVSVTVSTGKTTRTVDIEGDLAKRS